MRRSIFTGREDILTEEAVALPSCQGLRKGFTVLFNLESELLEAIPHPLGEKATDTALRAFIRFLGRSVRLYEASYILAIEDTNVLALWVDDEKSCISISGRLREWRMGSFSVRTAYGTDGPEAMRRLNEKIKKRVT